MQQVEKGKWKKIGEEHFKYAFRSIRSDSKKSKSTKSEDFVEIRALFRSTFLEEDKVDGKNLTQALKYAATEMLTAFKNNVSGNFVKYLTRYLQNIGKERTNQEQKAN